MKRIVWNKGKKMSQECKEKIRLAHLGKTHSIETRQKMSLSHSGEKCYWFGKKHSKETIQKLRKIHIGLHVGDKNGKWKIIKKDFRGKHSLLNKEYVEWRTSVFKRDKWQCKMCGIKGKLEAHHILPWRDFVELRYQINNGITLCRVHHPRKRADEAKLSPYFQELVAKID